MKSIIDKILSKWDTGSLVYYAAVFGIIALGVTYIGDSAGWFH